jgi:hypothetical protein
MTTPRARARRSFRVHERGRQLPLCATSNERRTFKNRGLTHNGATNARAGATKFGRLAYVRATAVALPDAIGRSRPTSAPQPTVTSTAASKVQRSFINSLRKAGAHQCALQADCIRVAMRLRLPVEERGISGDCRAQPGTRVNLASCRL